MKTRPDANPLTAAGLSTPIGRKAVSELVIQRILGLVSSGELSSGDRLPPERELAAQLDVSRPTVREALRALSILGVLEIRHGGGVYISSLDAAELLNPLDFFISLNAENLVAVFDARVHYEPMVAAIAAEQLDDEAIQHLQSLVDEQSAHPDDAELFHDTDTEFHKILIEASGNIFLSRIGKMLQVLGDQARKKFQRRKSIRARSIKDHQTIMTALHARDHEAAASAMRQHMVNVGNALREVTRG